MIHPIARRPFWRRHPWFTGATALVGVWLWWSGAQVLVAVLVIAGLAVFVDRRRRANARRDAQLRARAEFEHRLTAAGDPRGVFGRYPPVQAGWFADPHDPRQLRFFDGVLWTGFCARRAITR